MLLGFIHRDKSPSATFDFTIQTNTTRQQPPNTLSWIFHRIKISSFEISGLLLLFHCEDQEMFCGLRNFITEWDDGHEGEPVWTLSPRRHSYFVEHNFMNENDPRFDEFTQTERWLLVSSVWSQICFPWCPVLLTRWKSRGERLCLTRPQLLSGCLSVDVSPDNTKTDACELRAGWCKLRERTQRWSN